MPQEPLYFFSYSRQELYFAESATVKLQQMGLNIWFDLQQLEPGCHWGDEIQNGLEECSGLILLASQASLNSPWVAIEWEHALQQGKPIYILLFEAVDFDPIPASEKTNNRPIPLDKLLEEAQAVIDIRRDFRKNLRRLSSVINNNTTERDRIPKPGRLRIPSVMSLDMAVVTFSLILVSIVMFWISVYGLSVFWPMMLSGLMITAWIGERTLAFLQRRSFREVRFILPIALIVSLMISSVFTILLAPGTFLIIMSREVNRRSPLGQGIDRQRTKVRIELPSFLGRGTNLYNRIPAPIRLIILSVSTFFTFILIVNIRELPVLIIFPVFTGLLILFELNTRRSITESGKTYHIVNAKQDRIIARHVKREMMKAKHTYVENDEGDADYLILVLSNYTPDEVLQAYAQSEQQLICVIVSALHDWSRFKPLSHFQWVDYRSQKRQRLSAMALDILNIDNRDYIGHSFNTHQTPQSFDRVILPSLVSLLIGIFYIANFVLISNTMLTIIYPNDPITKLVTAFLALLFVVGNVWTIIRISNREIGLWAVVVFNLFLGFVNLSLGVRTGLFQAEISYLLFMNVIGNVVIVGFLAGNWLPSRYYRIPPLALKRDARSWRFHTTALAFVGLLTTSFLYNRFEDYVIIEPDDSIQEIAYNDINLSLEIPSYWTPADSSEYFRSASKYHVLAQAVERISLQYGTSLAVEVNRMLPGVDAVIIPLDPFDGLANVRLVDDFGFNPDASQKTRTLKFNIWEIPFPALYAGESRVLFDFIDERDNIESVSEAVDHEELRYVENQYVYSLPFEANILPLDFRLISFETPQNTYLFSIIGDNETLASESEAIDKLIRSVNIESQPLEKVTIALDGITFEVPSNWETVNVIDSEVALMDADPSESNLISFLQSIQQSSDQSQVIWGAEVVGFGETVFVSLTQEDFLTSDSFDIAKTLLQGQEGRSVSDDVSLTVPQGSVRILIIDDDLNERSEWRAGVFINEQTYSVGVYGRLGSLAKYSDTLTDWFNSFELVE